MAEAHEFHLKNGTTVVYESTPHTQIVTVQAWIKTGSVNENESDNGISHFLEHILFKGTKNFGPDEIDALVDSRGGQMNAGTSKDYTMYYVTLPAEYAETAAFVISDMIFNASFIHDEIEKEKPVVVQEIQRKFDNPTYDMWRDAASELYEGTPYAMEIIGTEENVNSFTPETLRHYYSTHYHPENTTVVIVGDISLDNTKKLAEKYFSQTPEATPAKAYSKTWAPKSLNQAEPKIYEREVSQEYVLKAYRLPATASGAPVYEVLSEILAGGEYSLLNQELKYGRGLVTAVTAGEMLSKNAGAYMFHMVTNPGESDAALAALDEIMADFIANGPAGADLLKAKNRLKSNTIFMKEKASSLANEIGYSYTLDNKDYYKTYAARIDKISAADVIKAAEQLHNGAIIYKTVPVPAGTGGQP